MKPYKQKNERKSRIFGILIIVFEIGCMIAYGVTGSFYNRQQTNYTQLFSLLMLAFFVIMGFGLLLSIYMYGGWLGIATAIIAISIAMQLGPLFQKLWFNVFITNFGQSQLTGQEGLNIRKFWDYYSHNGIQLSTQMYRISFLSCISFLTFMMSVISRLNIIQVCICAIIHQIVWNFNLGIMIKFSIAQDHNILNKTPLIFDTFGSSYVYLFAAFHGLGFLLHRRQKLATSHDRNRSSSFTLLLSLIGTCCILATFVFSSNNFIAYNAGMQNFARFSILFALIGSVAGTYAGSAFINRGYVGYKEAIVGTFAGGIIIGSAAPWIFSIGISIAIGASGGFISAIAMKLSQRINKNYTYDVLGLFGPILICSLLGSLVVPPVVVLIYNKYNFIVTLNEAFTYQNTMTTYQLIYPGISAGCGLLTGLISALCCRIQSEQFGLFASARYFLNQYGLYSAENQAQKQVVKINQQSQNQSKANSQQISIKLDENEYEKESKQNAKFKEQIMSNESSVKLGSHKQL